VDPPDAGGRSAAGSRAGGMNQSGRDAASRPDTSVRSIVSGIVQFGPVPSSLAHLRSAVCPTRGREGIPAPPGDPDGAHDAPSSVTRMSSLPLLAFRITTSVPSVVVLVAAM